MHLTLFFTRGVSLQTWDQTGMLQREVALYRKLIERGVQVSFVTHGLASDLDYAPQLPHIEILCNRKGRSPARYESWLRFLFAPTLARTNVIKTNQINGGEVALMAARFWRKPLVARCGYMWSEFALREADAATLDHALTIEEQVFTGAQQIILTTPMMLADLTHRLPQLAPRTHLIPNFVDTEQFAPHPIRKEVDLLFVGRLHPQKNLAALLEAIQPLKVTLRIIGTGTLESELKARFGDLDGRIQWLGNVPHHHLPEHFNQARAFILPSHYEGHPKTLIEAMACGLPVIGGDAPGIREILGVGEVGWLCPPTVEGIREAVQILLLKPTLQVKLGRNARQYALEHYALDHIVDLEMAVLKAVAPKSRLKWGK